MMLLATTLSLFLSADAATPTELLHYCKDGYDTWDSSFAVPEDNWYYGTDWGEWLANGTSPDGYTGNSPSSITISTTTSVYPAGFKPFSLARYSEPPICVTVDGSHDKKVEILMESPMDNVNLCIHDASYSGAGTNDVGSVQNCGTGKLYACFTAATAETTEDFGFYVDCESGCEDMAVDVWMRVRVSDRSWDDGKEGIDTDLEHWCEAERGTTVGDDGVTLYYTYPSDLLPDKPSKYPFHIEQIFGRNAGSQTRPNIWAVSLIALVGLACLFA